MRRPAINSQLVMNCKVHKGELCPPKDKLNVYNLECIVVYMHWDKQQNPFAQNAVAWPGSVKTKL